MKTLLVALATLLALAGCGSDSTSEVGAEIADESSASATPAEPATSEPPALTLRDICPQVEAALPADPIPDYTAISDFYDALVGFKKDGDLEAQNALDLLIDPTGSLQIEIQYKSKGQPLTSALSGFLDGISAFADRCQAAGSSALQ